MFANTEEVRAEVKTWQLKGYKWGNMSQKKREIKALKCYLNSLWRAGESNKEKQDKNIKKQKSI